MVQLGFNVQKEPTGFEEMGFPINGLSSVRKDFITLLLTSQIMAASILRIVSFQAVREAMDTVPVQWEIFASASEA